MSEEWFDIVDEQDRVVGRDTRQNVHTLGHIHRSVLFFLFDPQGRVFVNQRSMSKEFYPGYWSIVLGGHVPAGESYEAAARREAWEEAGVETAPMFIGSFQKRFDAEDQENVQVFGFLSDGEPKLDRSEIQHGRFVTLEGIEQMLPAEPFLPETRVLLPLLRQWLTLLRQWLRDRH